MNDRAERSLLADNFTRPPYGHPPAAPVVYMKPAAALAQGVTPLNRSEAVRVASTLALMFGRATVPCRDVDAMDHVAAMSLAIDFSLEQDNYYRPAVHLANRAGFLALGAWAAPAFPPVLETWIDDERVHVWPLDRLFLAAATLIARLSAFMTFGPGDILLTGLPGDAPRIGGSRSIRVEGAGLPPARAETRETGQ